MWAVVAGDLRDYRRQGFADLLTEDTVRFTTARALTTAGIDAARLRIEAPHPVLRGSRIDLLVGRYKSAALVELKYPREPNPANAAWTMTLGEVLKDFYRLASYPGTVDRVFVYLEADPLRKYMAGVARRYGVVLQGDTITLRPDEIGALPATATNIIGRDLIAHHVTAHRITHLAVDDTLRMAVYHVAPLAQQSRDRDEHAAELSLPPRPTRDGARREILDAIHAVLTRSGTDTFTPTEIITEMSRRNTGYAETTIRTMITGHLCGNAPDNAAITYDDLERIDHGRYRLTTQQN